MFDSVTLSPAKGSTRKRKRKGRGQGSGLGKTCGRGQNGKKSRSGGSTAPGFEGGQMPLIRRLPKRGFFNRFGKDVAIVNVGRLKRIDADSVVDGAALRAAGLVKGRPDAIKILGNGEIDRALTVRVDLISESARTKIEGAGGKVEVIGG